LYQYFKGTRCQPRNRPFRPDGEFFQKMGGQKGNILLAISQRRKYDGKDLNPVKKIFPESSHFHFLQQIAIG